MDVGIGIIDVGGLQMTDEEFAATCWPRQWWQDWTQDKEEEHGEE